MHRDLYSQLFRYTAVSGGIDAANNLNIRKSNEDVNCKPCNGCKCKYNLKTNHSISSFVKYCPKSAAIPASVSIVSPPLSQHTKSYFTSCYNQ